MQCNLIDVPDADLRTACLVGAVRAQNSPPISAGNFAEWCNAMFGPAITRAFHRPYTRKYWTLEPEELATDWIGTRVFAPNLDEVVDGAMGVRSGGQHHANRFRYPAHGGFEAFTRGLRERLAPRIRTGSRIVSLVPEQGELGFEDGLRDRYDAVISTLPLPELIGCIAGVPLEVRQAASDLAWTSHLLVSVGLGIPESPVRAQWLYIYAEDILCSRVSFPHLLARSNAPEGCSSLQAEIVHSRFRPITGFDAAARQCIEDLLRCGVIPARSAIRVVDVRNIEFANVIHTHKRLKALQTIGEYLRQVNVIAAGRYGDWENHWTDGSLLSGERAAGTLMPRRPGKAVRVPVSTEKPVD